MLKAVFFLTSPLQILCTLEAIEFFKINKANIIFAIDLDTENSKQMISVGKKYNLDYEILDRSKIYNGKISLIREYLIKFILKLKLFKFDYVFIGDPREKILQYIGITLLKKKGKLVYLDDGNISLIILSSNQEIFKGYNKIKSIVKRWTKDKENFFTNYYDLASENYKLIPNKFRYLSKQFNNKIYESSIFILGTPVLQFCNDYGVTVSGFQQIYDNLLNYLENKYPNYNIYYIPHRRDTCKETLPISLKHGVIVKKLNAPIENFLLESKNIPTIICGFGSSGLLTTKLLFPKITIYNVTFFINNPTPRTWELESISKYYEGKQINNIDLNKKEFYTN